MSDAVLVMMIAALVLIAGLGGESSSRAQTRVDFARDVQPILRGRCLECHGPTQQMNGYRLDRRSIALTGGTRPNIVPRSSESSRLYRRVLSAEFGTRMPPDDPLTRDEIDVLRRWIDEGAEWPDALANELELPPSDPAATRLTALIQSSQHRAALQWLRRTPSIVNGRGPGGATPLMHAALYGNATLVNDLLRMGADPNVRNDVGATALTWAVDDVEKVRLLVDRGADVNATTDFGRTPLMLAAAQLGSADTVKLLFERGASVNSTALALAAGRGDAAVVRLLLAAGARDANGAAAAGALRSNCRDCVDAILGAQRPVAMRGALLSVLPPAAVGHPDALREALDWGGDVNARDAKSRTVLMLAAISPTVSPASMRLLIDRGADANAKDVNGLTALDFAMRLGNTPVVETLVSAGASAAHAVGPTFTFVQGNTARGAVTRSLPLLQRTGFEFYEKSRCVSCHHNVLTAMTLAAARGKGFAVNETIARQESVTVSKVIEATREQALQGMSQQGLPLGVGYILMGLSAAHHPSDMTTDAMVRQLKLSQLPDGHWRTAYRPPSEASEFTATAVSLRGIQLYGRGLGRRSDAEAIRAATSWLETNLPHSTEDRVFRLFGLTWGHASRQVRQAAIRDLMATQRSDGGWAQLSSMQSDAYATGEALVALNEAGLRPTDAIYRRGVQFLLSTQLPDGSWFVRTRTHPTQIYFESGFPHGANQFISAAATNWATQALALAVDSSAGLSRSVASDPMDGTWELDVVASRFNPGPARTRDVRTYRVHGNRISMTGTVVHADGRVENIQFDAWLDGKDYAPTGNPRVEAIAQVRIDTHTIKTTTKRGGKVTATSTRQVSKDGRTMTIETTGTDVNGTVFNNTLVFRKRRN